MMMNQAVVSNPTVGSPMLAQILKDGKIKGSTHLGGSLERMVESYSSLQAVCGELIQNSIDLEFGGATSISIVVNFDQNKVAYLDNGKGLSVETIAHALNTIGKTVKASDKYGKFGIGMASPIAICEKFSMLTAQSGSPYIRVEFDRKSLYNTHIGGFNFPTKEEKTIFHQDGKTPRQNKWSNLSCGGPALKWRA